MDNPEEDSLDVDVTLRPEAVGARATVDQYAVGRKLGSGGFGAVYLARDMVAQIDVAIKGLPSFIKDGQAEMERIRANFALVSRLHHPHIAAALHLQRVKSVRYGDQAVRGDLRVEPGNMLMVMAYAPGTTLAKWRRQFAGGRVPFGLAVRIARQVADALDYAHGEHVVHRDVKPSNIMIETKSDGDVAARLLDFGLAMEILPPSERISGGGASDKAGTRAYMAPEQWDGGELTAATDQYALAALLYDLLVGTPPFAPFFETGDESVARNAVCNHPLEFPAGCTCRSAFRKALAKKPSARFGSCAEFVDAVAEEYASGRKKVLVGIVAACMVVCALGVGIALWPRESTPVKPSVRETPVKPSVRETPVKSPEQLSVRKESIEPKMQPAHRARPVLEVQRPEPVKRPAPPPAPPLVKKQEVPQSPIVTKMPAAGHGDEVVVLEERQSRERELQRQRAAKAKLADISKRIAEVKKLAQGVLNEAKPFRDDNEGLARHLNGLEDECRVIEIAKLPDDAEDAEEMLKKLVKHHLAALDELEWLKKNAASKSRKEAKGLLREIENDLLPKCREMEDLGLSCMELVDGMRNWKSAREFFADGEFDTAVRSLKVVKKNLFVAYQKLSKVRLEKLVLRAQELKRKGEWNECAKAANEVLKVDPMNLEMEMLRDEALGHCAGKER